MYRLPGARCRDKRPIIPVQPIALFADEEWRRLPFWRRFNKVISATLGPITGNIGAGGSTYRRARAGFTELAATGDLEHFSLNFPERTCRQHRCPEKTLQHSTLTCGPDKAGSPSRYLATRILGSFGY